jgi:hypothetical protein
MYHVVNTNPNHPYVHHVETIAEAHRVAQAERKDVGGEIQVLTDEEWDAFPNRRRYWAAATSPTRSTPR